MTPVAIARRGARKAGDLLAGRNRALRKVEKRLRKDHKRRLRKLERRLVKRLDKRAKRIERRLPPDLADAVVKPIDYDEARIELRARTPRERYRLDAVAKKPWTVERGGRATRPGECLYDVGANVGAYSLIAAVGPARAFVVSFEPGFANYATLCENVVHNRAGDRVMPVPLALSDAVGTSSFNYRDTGSGEALHGMGADGAGAVFRQGILTLTLDDVVERHGLRAPNHLKLDVDGAEAAVLRGGARTVASPELRSVMIELSSADAPEVGGLLEAAGLERARQTDRRVKNGATVDQWYELWTRPEGASTAT